MNLPLLHNLSVLLGLCAYVALLVFCIVTLVKKITGKALLSATLTTLAFIAALGATGESVVTLTLGLLMQFCWITLALRAVGLGFEHVRSRQYRGLVGIFAIALMALVAGVGYTLGYLPGALAEGTPSLRPVMMMELLLAVTGLVCIEQLVRNGRSDLRWRLRLLTLALGLMFTFALVHSAAGVLYGAHFLELTAIYPTILTIAVPFLMAASLRNRDTALRFNVSREFAFRTGVLFVVGVSLLIISLAGYYTRLFGGDIGNALIVLLGAVCVLGLLVVIGSNRFRSRLRRYIAENFYARKYDYREVWDRVSGRLTEPSADFSLPQQCIRSCLDILDAPTGALWLVSEAGTLIPHAQLHSDWQQPLSRSLSQALAGFFAEREWVIDLNSPPSELNPTEVDALLDALPGVRFLVPLFVQEEFFGLIAIGQPHAETELTWEDYDILKLVSGQTAGFLALRRADARLSETKQLDAVNRLSAFVVHDLKTIAAQLSLLLENADKHKTNPAFVEDMIITVGNANDRMQRLLDQFRTQAAASLPVDLSALLAETVAAFADQTPAPVLTACDDRAFVNADPKRLAAVIGHTIDNAIQATPMDGEVRVHLRRNGEWVEVLVEDTGCGMEASFVADKLFTPFESTKGLSGMGIGAYQTRDYLRSLGGDVEVCTAPGAGTRFTLRIPGVASA